MRLYTGHLNLSLNRLLKVTDLRLFSVRLGPDWDL